MQRGGRCRQGPAELLGAARDHRCRARVTGVDLLADQVGRGRSRAGSEVVAVAEGRRTGLGRTRPWLVARNAVGLRVGVHPVPRVRRGERLAVLARLGEPRVVELDVELGPDRGWLDMNGEEVALFLVLAVRAAAAVDDTGGARAVAIAVAVDLVGRGALDGRPELRQRGAVRERCRWQRAPDWRHRGRCAGRLVAEGVARAAHQRRCRVVGHRGADDRGRVVADELSEGVVDRALDRDLELARPVARTHDHLALAGVRVAVPGRRRDGRGSRVGHVVGHVGDAGQSGGIGSLLDSLDLHVPPGRVDTERRHTEKEHGREQRRQNSGVASLIPAAHPPPTRCRGPVHTCWPAAQVRVGNGSNWKTAWSSMVTSLVKNPVRKSCLAFM